MMMMTKWRMTQEKTAWGIVERGRKPKSHLGSMWKCTASDNDEDEDNDEHDDDEDDDEDYDEDENDEDEDDEEEDDDDHDVAWWPN